MEGNIYFLDGSGYIYYDGTSAYQVTGYVPRHYISKSPGGTSGSKIDELNYISSGFKEEFNGDGTSTSYYLTYGSLTTQTPIVLVDNATQTLSAATAGFTVNYTSAYVNFTTAPSTGTNNVEITAYKPVMEATQIINCTIPITYGQGNDTNVYLTGNSSYPARVYWSDILDPTYFPATSYADIGVTNDRMMAMIEDGNSLLLLKRRSIYVQNGSPPNQTITEILKGEGCIATDTVKIVDGYPMFYSQRGIVQIVPTDQGVRLELISRDIQGGYGTRSGLASYTESQVADSFSHVFDNMYIWTNHVAGSTYYIWIYQYLQKHQYNNEIVYPWVKWLLAYSNVGVQCLADKDGSLYFGGWGNIFKFDKTGYTDAGTAINATWTSKEWLNGSDWIKNYMYQHWDFRIDSMTGNSGGTVTLKTFVDTNKEPTEAPTASSVITLTPTAETTAASNYTVTGLKTFIHKKGTTVQYSLSCTGYFVLLGTKIDYLKDRRR